MQRETSRQPEASAKDTPKSDKEQRNEYAAASPALLTSPDNTSRKRNLPGFTNQAAGTLTSLFSPARHERESDDEQHHHDIFANMLDGSRMSDDFLHWPMHGSFADDEDTFSREKLEATWHHSPDWDRSHDAPAGSSQADLASANARKFDANLLSPLKLQGLAASDAPATASSTNGASASFGTIARNAFSSPDNKNYSLRETFNRPSNLQLSSPGPQIFNGHGNDRNLDDQSTFVAKFPSTAEGTATLFPSRTTTATTEGSLVLSSPSSSSGGFSDHESDSIEPRQLYDGSPPSSMQVTLGRSSQTMFERINSKLKSKSDDTKMEVSIPDSSAPKHVRKPWTPACHEGYPQAAYLHDPRVQQGFMPPPPPPPPVPPPVVADVAISYRQQPPGQKASVASSMTSSTKASAPLANLTTQTKAASTPAQPKIVVSADRKDKENGPSTGSKDQKSSRITCKCKKSRCLKMYCDCFSVNEFCDSCKCNDCHNLSTPFFQPARDVAIKEALLKNPHAFEPRIDVKSHNMGCRCKKSECVKKYCECFQARVLCTSKCKCTGCLNVAGSQQLIDKRRRMKDAVGAQLAMEESEKKWKAQGPSRTSPKPGSTSKLPSPAVQMRHHPRPYFYESPHDSIHAHSQFPPNHYMGHAMPYQYPHMQHMFIPYGTPNGIPHRHGYATPQLPATYPNYRGEPPTLASRSDSPLLTTRHINESQLGRGGANV
ncbi:hypothetical protein MPSEU_001049600 [Mayamaea pseudoterrestris]|nr:hypothetical protein MPSEU_001049600 [Mayamaea pseudoterrestris]